MRQKTAVELGRISEVMEDAMGESTLEALMRRLDHLERENRRWKAMSAGVLLLLSLIVFAGATWKAPIEVRSSRFVLTDKEGRQRATLEMLSNEMVRLVFYDRTETQTLSISRKLPTR
jgi:hypothetical protein